MKTSIAPYRCEIPHTTGGRFRCTEDAVFWIYPKSRPSGGHATCQAHLGKAARMMIKNTAVGMAVVEPIECD